MAGRVGSAGDEAVGDGDTRHGAAVERVTDQTGEKAALWVTVGPADRPGYVLSGHRRADRLEGHQGGEEVGDGGKGRIGRG
jgi:hypothetical protein